MTKPSQSVRSNHNFNRLNLGLFQYLHILHTLFPGDSEYLSKTPLVEHFKSVKLRLSSIPNLTSIKQHSENSSLIDPYLGAGLDVAVLPYAAELIVCSRSLLNASIQFRIKRTITGDFVPQICE